MFANLAQIAHVFILLLFGWFLCLQQPRAANGCSGCGSPGPSPSGPTSLELCGGLAELGGSPRTRESMMKRRPILSYSTKHHLKRRIIGTDWLFLAAIIGIIAFVIVVIRFF
jgi:hypothetical protein